MRECIKDIGYDQDGFSWKTANVETIYTTIDRYRNEEVDSKDNKDEGAGDQGLCLVTRKETEDLMPAPIHYSHKILRLMAEDRKSGNLKGLSQIQKVK